MTGMISLVGAGPGDCELLTVKGQRRLKEADVVVYDRLVNRELLSLVNPNCELIYVGKEPQYHPVPQDQIADILIEKAQKNQKIVRLKGGDPYVFGRGGEEGAALLEQGISFEVVPGITSAIGGLAYAGIPITHRYVAGSFHVITAHRGKEGLDIDWPVIAKLSGTLVFLMGVSELATITQELQANGKADSTPIALVHWATRSKQQTVVGNLTNICQKVAEAKITSPSLIVVGEVIALRETLNVFESRSLFGKQLLMPMTAHQRLAHRLTDEGASIVTYPSAQRVETQWELPRISDKELVFTDAKSWSAFIRKWYDKGYDIRHLPQAISGVGHHTCQALAQSGIQLKQSGLSLSELTLTNEMIIFGSDREEKISEQANIPLIKTHIRVYDQRIKAELSEVSAICLPHSQAAEDLLHYYQLSELENLPIITMGEQTASVLNDHGLKVYQTSEPSFDAIINKIQEVLL